ncbi:MAG: acyl-CoA dehydrogenase [Deltaproteobacteria bacterium]|nr:acyl-CoA dehydrogenase [Deltaproteobacteria bacterium]
MAESTHFKMDLREIEFSLFEQFGLQTLFKNKLFSHISEEDARLILKEAHTFATEIIAPTYVPGDQEGCSLTPEGVRVPASLKAVWKQYYENGWNALTLPESLGGQGAPQTLGVAVAEMMSGANTAFSMYPGLSMGATSVIRAFGTPEQQELYCAKMENGTWGGTMVLTEPNAGSDVGMSLTKAVPAEEGSYSITGNKIFISGGDQDITENIIHLVLARIEGAPKGSRGLSLFIIPKVRVKPDGSLGEPNDVVCTNIEHKMGINASATAALAFGEKGKCRGWLVGGEPKAGAQPGEGIRKMFLMMNTARIGVAVQSVSIMSTAYLNALAYARTRLQGAHLSKGRPKEGAVPIIQHPDVRRMLLDMKARVEGARSLLLFTASLMDQERASGNGHGGEGYSSLFIPMAKAHTSDTAVQVSSMAMQVFGGAGYTRDFPAEQYLRDSRIFPIYEGTNGIQALDLVGRKLAQSGGALVNRFLEEQTAFLKSLGERKGWSEERSILHQAMERFGTVLGKFTMKGMTGDMESVAVAATPFQEAMSQLLVARLLGHAALIAQDALAGPAKGTQDEAFYQGKVASARYYLRNIVPHAAASLDAISGEDRSAMDIPDAGFSLAF